MAVLSQAAFLASVGAATQLPPRAARELVFAGRSNVGKSSAINALANRKKLAFTSKTPGRTQTINFFSLGDEARLIDLPGYGYARVPKPLRAQWEELIGEFLRSHAPLHIAVVVMDARHPLTDLDRQLFGWLEAERVLALLSKADKLTRREQAATLASVKAELGSSAEVRLFSSLSRQGVEECRELLEAWLANDTRHEK